MDTSVYNNDKNSNKSKDIVKISMYKIHESIKSNFDDAYKNYRFDFSKISLVNNATTNNPSNPSTIASNNLTNNVTSNKTINQNDITSINPLTDFIISNKDVSMNEININQLDNLLSNNNKDIIKRYMTALPIKKGLSETKKLHLDIYGTQAIVMRAISEIKPLKSLYPLYDLITKELSNFFQFDGLGSKPDCLFHLYIAQLDAFICSYHNLLPIDQRSRSKKNRGRRDYNQHEELIDSITKELKYNNVTLPSINESIDFSHIEFKITNYPHIWDGSYSNFVRHMLVGIADNGGPKITKIRQLLVVMLSTIIPGKPMKEFDILDILTMLSIPINKTKLSDFITIFKLPLSDCNRLLFIHTIKSLSNESIRNVLDKVIIILDKQYPQGIKSFIRYVVMNNINKLMNPTYVNTDRLIDNAISNKMNSDIDNKLSLLADIASRDIDFDNKLDANIDFTILLNSENHIDCQADNQSDSKLDGKVDGKLASMVDSKIDKKADSKVDSNIINSSIFDSISKLQIKGDKRNYHVSNDLTKYTSNSVLNDSNYLFGGAKRIKTSSKG